MHHDKKHGNISKQERLIINRRHLRLCSVLLVCALCCFVFGSLTMTSPWKLISTSNITSIIYVKVKFFLFTVNKSHILLFSFSICDTKLLSINPEYIVITSKVTVKINNKALKCKHCKEAVVNYIINLCSTHYFVCMNIVGSPLAFEKK